MSTPRSAWRDARVGEVDEVAERELNLDPQPSEPARVADQHPHLVAALEQLREERLAHRPGRAGEQDHRPAL